MQDRDAAVRRVIEGLELNMEFLGITGVEDKLQENVQTTLESLRNAGIKIWMLTGDKVATAKCIAISAGLKSVHQPMFTIRGETDALNLQNSLNEFGNRGNTVLVIDGESIATALMHHRKFFFEVSSQAPAVVCCRCSPTQKAIITECIKYYT